MADIQGLVHDADYRQSKKNWDDFVEKMTEKIIEIDETVPELPPKDLVRNLAKRRYPYVLIRRCRPFVSVRTRKL